MTENSSPRHPIVFEMHGTLNEEQREFYEERAGVLEFEANLEPLLAEALAMLEVIKRYGWIRHRRN